MKKQFLPNFFFIFLFVLAVTTSCRKIDTINPGDQQKQERTAELKFFEPVLYRTWKISSESVFPAQNGSTVYPVDSCNKKVTYVFGQPDSAAGIITGHVAIDYHYSSCGGAVRTANPPPKQYFANGNPLKLQWPDDGMDYKNYTYTIIRATNDSLVISSAAAGITYTKVYLTVSY